MSNVRWEPVDEWTERCNTIWPWVDLDYSAEPDDAGIMLTACDENGHVTANVVAEYALPPDVRLCRAVPVPWSQEPPDAPGDWWVWRKAWDDTVARIRVAHRQTPDGIVHLWAEYEDGFRKAIDDFSPDTWYMPATVPQPPGEVGP